MRKGRDGIEAEHGAGAHDGVESPKKMIDRLARGITRTDLEDDLFDLAEEVFRFI
jgi:hypothetical protein